MRFSILRKFQSGLLASTILLSALSVMPSVHAGGCLSSLGIVPTDVNEACRNGDVEALKRIYNSQGYLRINDEAISEALTKKDTAVCEYLNAKVDTSLIQVVSNSDASIVEYYFSLSNITQNNRDTFLRCAIDHGDIDKAELAIQHGADVFTYCLIPIPNASCEIFLAGNTLAMALLVKNNSQNIREWLISKGVPTDNDICGTSDSDMIEGAKRHAYPNTPLHVASSIGDLYTVKWLVETCQANINVADSSGNTPLSLARRAGNMSVVSYLRSRGAH